MILCKLTFTNLGQLFHFPGENNCVLVIDRVEREHEGRWKCILHGRGVQPQFRIFQLELTQLQDCTWSEWQPWGTCSATCGSGVIARRRNKFQPALGGGRECEDSGVEAKECNIRKCEAIPERG